MVFPQYESNVIDPGIGAVQPAADTPLFTGVAFGGSVAVETLASISHPTLVR